MSNSFMIITKIFPIILLIITGSFFREIHLIKPSSVEDLKKLIVNLALPAVLFLTFSTTHFQPQYFWLVTVIFITCVLLLLIGMGITRLLIPNKKYLPSLFSGFEMGMMGYALFTIVFGVNHLFNLAIVDLGQVLFVFFILVTYIEKKNGLASSPLQVVNSFFKSPVIISIIAGITIGSLGWAGYLTDNLFTNAFLETFKFFSNLVVPLICLEIGYELRFDWKNMNRPIVLALSRFGLNLIFAYLINQFILIKILNMDRMFSIALYTMFILPPPFVIPIFMKNSDEEEKQLILNTITFNIILSLIAYPVLLILMDS